MVESSASLTIVGARLTEFTVCPSGATIATTVRRWAPSTLVYEDDPRSGDRNNSFRNLGADRRDIRLSTILCRFRSSYQLANSHPEQT